MATIAPRACKITHIARCDWLPERARWSHLARLGLPAVSRKKNFLERHIINPLLTKLVLSTWLDIGLVLFSEFMDRDEELCQYPAILTSHLVNNPSMFLDHFCQHSLVHEAPFSDHVIFDSRLNKLGTRWHFLVNSIK